MAENKATTSKLKEKLANQENHGKSNLPADPVKKMAVYLEKMKPRIMDALPKHIDADRVNQIAITTMRMNKDLQDCTIESFLGAVMQSAQLGLEPNLMGSCYFIPFKNNKNGGQKEVQFMIGYRGMIDLARRSGDVLTITSNIVYENDEFEFEYGLNENLKHVPARTNRGGMIYCYAYAKLKNGGHAFEVMSIEDIHRIRDEHSAGYKNAVKYKNESSSVWVKHFESMAKKTTIKQLIKFLPISVELQNQVASDETYRKDITSEPEFIEYDQEVEVIDHQVEQVN